MRLFGTFLNALGLFGITFSLSSLGSGVSDLPDLSKLNQLDIQNVKLQERLSLELETSLKLKNSNLKGKSGRFDELVPFVLPSPDQEEAGSCMYMALTGIAEWWLARLNPNISRTSDGPIDLSERYLMNLGAIPENSDKLENWKTDSIYLFNNTNSTGILNTDFRYTKGWFKNSEETGLNVKAKPDEKGAEYGTGYNWVTELEKVPRKSQVKLPKFSREIIFLDPAGDLWNVGVAPEDIVEVVKLKLRTTKAPVLVIYNHDSYWHAVYVIGYNDHMDNGSCAYTENFRKNLEKKTNNFLGLQPIWKNPFDKSTFESRLIKAKDTRTKLEEAYERHGGCTSSKGVFYVRDSIYSDFKAPLYDYDMNNQGEERVYTKGIVFKEYDWLYYFANHVAVVTAK
jgi:hypothetical protein